MNIHLDKVAKTVAVASLMFGATIAHAQTTTPAPTPTVAPPAQMASQQPIPLFKAVCVDGIAKLSRKWASATNYASMPEAARTAVGQPVMSVPNPVYQIGGGNEFLIIPASESTMPFAQGCAVVWQGNDLAAAQKLIPAPPESQVVVTASATGGWVVLKSMPTPAPAQATGVR